MSDDDGQTGEAWRPAEHGSQKGSLERRVARGLTWTMVDSWGRQLLSLVVLLILARLLTPDEFGLVALAMVFVAFAQLVVDQGLGDALIQRREVTRIHIDTAFWVAVATGLLLTIAGFVLADPIAGLLKQPALGPILKVLSLTFVLSAMSSIQVALLRRELAYRSLALRTIVATVAGGVVGVVLAFAGAGVWALVGQQAAATLFAVLTLWRVSPWTPSLRASRRHFGELFGFGINVMGSDVLNYLSRNMDNLLVGAVLGTTPLGFYAVGYRVLEVSQGALVQVTRKLTFPAFSRIQHEPERLRRAYLRLTKAASVLILPGYTALALVAPELIVVLFGDRWAPSAPVAMILLAIGPVLSVQAFSSALLNAAGHPHIVFRFRLLTTVTNVVGFAVAVPFGIVAVALAFVVRGYLLLPLILYWMQVYGHIPVRQYLLQLRGPALATMAMAASIMVVKWALDSHVAAPVLLAAELSIAALTVAASLWLLERELVRDVLRMIRLALPGARSVGRRLQRDRNTDDA